MVVNGALLAAFPDGITEADNDGNLALHSAADSQTGEHGLAMVNALIAAFPEGEQEKDCEDRLPFARCGGRSPDGLDGKACFSDHHGHCQGVSRCCAPGRRLRPLATAYIRKERLVPL